MTNFLQGYILKKNNFIFNKIGLFRKVFSPNLKNAYFLKKIDKIHKLVYKKYGTK